MAAPPLPERIGRYKVSRRLGLGAMGRVYLAHDPVLDRDVAVKLLRDDLGIPEDQRKTLLERMRQEARAAARVSHPNIVALHDMGEDPVVGLFLVFEYLEGETLKERIVRGPLGARAAAQLARDVGSALATAHEAGVLHRDIKPENLILTRTGAKIADFGIARVPDSTLTLGGGLLGTPAYSAPEALSDGKFSPRSDQFSLAATLYEGLSGRRAFAGDDAMAVASQIATEDPLPIAETCGVDPHVDIVLSRALAKNPRERFDSCDDFGRALAEAIELAPRSRMATLPDEVHLQAAQKEVGAKTTRAAVGGAAIGALLAIAAFQITAPMREVSEAAEPRQPTTAPRALERRDTRALPIAWLAERPAPPRATPKQPAPPPRRARTAAATDGGTQGSKGGTGDAGPSGRRGRDGGAP